MAGPHKASQAHVAGQLKLEDISTTTVIKTPQMYKTNHLPLDLSQVE